VGASQPKAPRLPAIAIGLSIAALLAIVGMAMCLAALSSVSAASCDGPATAGSVHGVPPRLAPIYEQAAVKYGLGAKGPSILAAINFVETDFGTNMSTSTAGAIGWMQFEPESWTAFGIDGNGDGTKDAYNPWDAIFAAAHLLHVDGAPSDWHGAIFDYNRADWYVAEVLADAEKYDGGGSTVATSEAASCELAAPNERVARMIAEAERLSLLRPTSAYVWGGSHGETPTPPNGPFDCSSAVSHLLQVGSFKNPTMDTVALLGWAEPGPGRWMTIYDKPYGEEAHTFIKFTAGLTPSSKRYWGTSGFVEPGHGPGWIPESVFSAGYLAGFEQLHPAGF
jgi:hypothetical protein